MRAVDISAPVRSIRPSKSGHDDLAWWREARFGLFIHWGLYAIPAGVWQGKRVPYIGEWMMFREKIPVATYSRLAAQFHPHHWNPAAIVRLAKEAGMGYIVITAKHHEGFAMYRSKVSPYNVVDATPWRHDPMVDLAKECRRQGLRLCFYYSQDLDWHHPDGAWNDWDYPKDKKNPDRYLREKVLPQLTELLTNYGPVGMIWFDTPLTLSRAQSATIRRHVKRLQPHCLVSGRIGHGLGDYSLPRDNFLPPGRLKGDWETCATLNHTWGFKKHDHEWKSATNLITTLVDLTSKGSNYLLNIGPDADGVVPAPSVSRLRAVGAWLKVNGVAVKGASPSPFGYEFPWGRITTKGRTLFFHFFEKPTRLFRLHGLRTRVVSIAALSEPGKTFPFRQTNLDATSIPVLAIDFTGARFVKPVTVIAVKLAASPEVEPLTLQQPDRTLTFIGPMAGVGTRAKKPAMRIGGNGLTENWRNHDDYLEWKFTVTNPGAFDVTVVTTHQHLEPWSGGHTLRVEADGQSLRRVTRRDGLIPGLRSVYYPQIGTRFGQLTLDRAGTYTLRLRADRMKLSKKNKTLFSDGGMQFSEIRLTPSA
ncbi:MAG: Alpha-L-fucosidase [Verrucomicrobia bacterium]|nr:Alpha-L-fucosidase [Verrucomicrobiota bacterium]